MKKAVSFSQLDDAALVRQSQLVPNVLPFSAATLWRKVRDGSFVEPIKLSRKVTAFRVGDIRQWLADQPKA